MIRDYTQQDLEEIMKIWLEGNVSAHDFIGEQYWMDHASMVRAMLPDASIFVIEEKEQLLGFVGVQESYLAGIFVSGEARGKGIGTSLLTHCKQRYARLSLSVYEKNEKALHFYKREGFEMTHSQIEEDTQEVVYLMEWHRG